MEKTIALITGANTGVGFEAVKQFYAAETPYHILLGGRSRDKVDEAVQRVKEELGSGPARGEVEGVVIDITSDESIQALAGLVESKFGRIDVLINNAGGSDVSWVTQG
jgi:NAD(P)-dependent dehydrogenase (short-subunit alcohol dehydrogenase family)